MQPTEFDQEGGRRKEVIFAVYCKGRIYKASCGQGIYLNEGQAKRVITMACTAGYVPPYKREDFEIVRYVPEGKVELVYRVKSLIQTCAACPSQWEGVLCDGRTLYIRFRWGCLTLSVEGKQVFGCPHGTEYSGGISLKTVDELTGDLFDFSEVL